MPRDANGNYTLPAGNPVVSGTIIASNWANTTMADIGNEITESLSRLGEGGMQAPLKLTDGTAGAPGLTWGVEVASGLYRDGAEDYRYSILGTDIFQWTSTFNAAYGGQVTLADLASSFITCESGNDPQVSQHLAFSSSRIQSKSNATTFATLFLNPLGGAVFIGPASGTGSVVLQNNGDIVGTTVDATSGGLTVNNTLTGAGLERVLTESDLPSSTNPGQEVFTANGTFNTPAGINRLKVTIVGGGGSGGWGAAGLAGGGGGGGQNRTLWIDSPDPSYSVVIGLGGAVTTNGNDGNAGGQTSFGAFIAAGGAGGFASGEGGRGGGSTYVATNTEVSNNGQAGGAGNSTWGGNGGSSIFGGGSNGGELNSLTFIPQARGAGSGGAFGAGATSSAGSDGIVIVEYFP